MLFRPASRFSMIYLGNRPDAPLAARGMPRSCRVRALGAGIALNLGDVAFIPCGSLQRLYVKFAFFPFTPPPCGWRCRSHVEYDGPCGRLSHPGRTSRDAGRTKTNGLRERKFL